MTIADLKSRDAEDAWMSELLDAFAMEAARFVEWAKELRLKDADAAREALVRISSLYTAALHLPRA